ncbi:MAG: TetR/AcrR family transcriptional regulator [Chloroflexota bacterium]|nr:TetR/AcrR family transcriptional regulator [Actinomycetota bacterium]MDQ5827721.1 TetR/AcrR family transcriptional regulator [Chloroflexota bacterium]
MREPTKRERQAEERRNQLVDAALRLFAEKGFEKTTIKDLSEAVGVAQGLIYHYFDSKEELLFAAVDRHGFLPELRRVLAASYERPAEEVLPEIAGDFYALLEEKRDLVRVFFRESQTNPEVGKRLVDIIREGVGLLARYLAARIAVGELRPHDPEVTARTLLYTVQMLHITGRTPADDFVPKMVENLLYGIKAD